MRRRYRTILTQTKRELPAPPQRISGRRGRIARSDAQNLHEALLKHEDAALRFARDPDVPFTNNRAERDVRMAKVKQKVSGCFRTLRHAEAHCRISSYLQSMALQGWNPIAAIEIALNGKAADSIQQIPQDTPPEKARGASSYLVAIIRKSLHLDASLYATLQILSVTILEKTLLNQILSGSHYAMKRLESPSLLILFD